MDARARLTDTDTSAVRVDVSMVLGQTVTAYRGAAPGVDVSFVGQSPLYAWVDVSSLNRVCSLLIDNAVAGSPAGGEVTVCASAREGMLVIEVVDQGMGSPSDVAVFGPQRVGAAGSHPSGSGLGLYTVRTLVGAMGGDVSYHRNGRRGSTSEVVLPLDRHPGMAPSN